MTFPTFVHAQTVLLSLADGESVDEATAVPADNGPDDPLAAKPVLLEGTRLLDYEIIGLIGHGGFGIVYLAYDAAHEQHVAIKEYLPAGRALRDPISKAVAPSAPQHDESFRVGLRSFLNEARLLARFDHASVVKVLHFWEDNGTAYMVMPYYSGPTLTHALGELTEAPNEQQLLDLLRPLLDGLSTLHAMNCFHRDVAPDNILLTEQGALLLDFGAARRMVGHLAQESATMLKHGFAPIEQYAESPTLKQGAWTDLYALAAVMYTVVAGHAPPAATERLQDDRMPLLSDIARGRYSPGFLAAIDAALALRPEDRPQSATEFWARLTVVPADPVVEGPQRVVAAVPPDALASASMPMVAAPAAVGPVERTRRHVAVPVLALLLAMMVIGLAVVGYGYLARDGGAPSESRLVERPAAAGPAPNLPAPSVAPMPASAPVPAAQLTPTPEAVAKTAPATESASHALSATPGPAVAFPSVPVAATPPVMRGQPAAGRPVAAAPTAATATPARATARPTSNATPASSPDQRRRCSEILQSASLGPLSAGDAAFLKGKCQ